MNRMGSQGLAEATNGRSSHISADRPTFSLTLTLPIAWEALTKPPENEMLDRLERSNGAVLATLLKCADLGKPPIEDEMLSEALEPLRIKIDMIVEMLARLSYREMTRPDPRPVELGLGHMRWSQSEPLVVDNWLLSKIYFNDTYQEPIVLAGRVASCVTGRADGVCDIEVDLVEIADGLGESFARLVFLEHRRQLALHAGHRSSSARGR